MRALAMALVTAGLTSALPAPASADAGVTVTLAYHNTLPKRLEFTRVGCAASRRAIEIVHDLTSACRLEVGATMSDVVSSGGRPICVLVYQLATATAMHLISFTPTSYGDCRVHIDGLRAHVAVSP